MAERNYSLSALLADSASYTPAVCAILVIIVILSGALFFLVMRSKMQGSAPVQKAEKPKKQKTPAAEAAASEVIGEESIKAVSKKQTVVKILVQAALYLFLTVMAVMILFPFYFMLISSVKSTAEYNEMIPTLWPRRFVWGNYLAAFTGDLHLGRLFLNTVIVGVVSTLLSLVVTILSAYAFARLEFKGKNIMFAAMLATMMIPGELFTITNYITVVNWLNWRNTFTALIVPFLVSVFYIYLLRQNFMQIPNELYLAAKVDGTSDLKYLWKVMIPLSAPTLISITILKMMGAWNSYIWPKLVANDLAHRLVTVGLRGGAFTDANGLTNIPAQMAAVVLVTLPLLLVFLFFRKYIMRGVSRSGIKGRSLPLGPRSRLRGLPCKFRLK